MRDRHHDHAQAGEPSIGVTVGSLMSSPPVVVGSEITSADALHQLEHQTHSAYPVVGHDGRAVGLLMTADLERARHGAYATLVSEIAYTHRELLVEPWLDAGRLVDSDAFRLTRHAVVVNRDGRAVGIVSESDVRQALRSAELSEVEPVS